MATDSEREALAKKMASYKIKSTTSNGFPVLKAVGKGGKTLGEMTLDAPDAQGNRPVRMVEVNPEVRRQGIAKALWTFAQEKGLNPAHSAQRSAEGDAWARSVGGTLPKRSSTQINTGQALTPAEIARLNAPSSAVNIRPGLNFLGGGANVLSFLPMILEGGKIAQGTSSMLPRFDRVN